MKSISMSAKPEMRYNRIKPRTYAEEMGPMKMDDKHLPSITLSLKDIPAAKGWEVGNKYTIELQVKQTGKHEEKQGNGRVTFDILKVGTENEDFDDEEDLDEEDDGEDEE